MFFLQIFYYILACDEGEHCYMGKLGYSRPIDSNYHRGYNAIFFCATPFGKPHYIFTNCMISFPVLYDNIFYNSEAVKISKKNIPKIYILIIIHY